MIDNEINEKLFSMQDLKYKSFQERLIPNVSSDRVIGVRTPMLRAYAKELGKVYLKGDNREKVYIVTFLNSLPHLYYEEDNLHCFIVEQIKDYNKAMEMTEIILPYINNWATCDSFMPKVFRKNLQDVYDHILVWLQSDKTYTIRYGIGLLMGLFLDEAFTPEILELVAAVDSEEYYVNMMRAWFFCTALTKQYPNTISYIEEQKLDVWTHNKTIQKAIESYRINDETTAYLRTLKV